MANQVQVTDNTETVKAELPSAIAMALEAIGEIAEGYAKENTPVDTGRLRNSISHAVAAGPQEVYIGTNVEYAPLVEDGSSKQKAHHMLRDAAQNHADEYRNIFETAMKTH